MEHVFADLRTSGEHDDLTALGGQWDPDSPEGVGVTSPVSGATGRS
jgi:hypothetical protein